MFGVYKVVGGSRKVVAKALDTSHALATKDLHTRAQVRHLILTLGQAVPRGLALQTSSFIFKKELKTA
jgi:hypothetical protein